MTAPLNIISLPGKSSAGTPGASAPAAGATAGAGTAGDGGFQSLLAVLLNLLAQTGTQTVSTANGAAGADGAISSNTQAAQTGSAGIDLGGLLDLSALLDLKAQLSAQLAETGEASEGVEVAAADGETETIDPLAAVLDLLIGALQSAANAQPEGTALTLDGKSANALDALNKLLASLAGETPSKSPVQLPSETIDKLNALNALLANQNADPELAELKTRIADLLGTSEAKKTADARTPDAAALLGQDGNKTGTTTQRDVVSHVLDGARTGLKSGGGESGGPGTGDTPDQGQQQAQPQNARAEHAARQPQATAGDFAQQIAASGKDGGQAKDASSETLITLASQSGDRTQAQARVLPNAYTQAANRVDVPQIAFEIARQAANGVSRFQIRLDPPEMGRIDVRLDLDKSGAVNARLTVDRPETLDLLQRDARALERALGQSGLDQSKTNLEFSLRQNPFARQDFGQGQNQNQEMAGLFGEDEAGSSETETALPPPVTLYRGAVRPGGVNLVA